MSTSSTPAVPIVVGFDDELLDATHLLPVAATVAAIANAGHWYLLRYDPQARELRLNPSPGPDRTPQIVRRFRHQVQRKANPSPYSRPRWTPVNPALAQQFAALEALALHGPATAIRCLLRHQQADYRVDIQIRARADAPPAFAGALFTFNPATDGRPSA